MFSTLFEHRDKKISLLIKLGDCIGRSLRENVTLFSIDGQNNQVTYLTEKEKVISGNFEIDKDVVLHNIKVQDSSIYEDGNIFDEFVNEKIHSFVENIHSSEYANADNNFSDILSLWENRIKLDSVQEKIARKTEQLQAEEKIMESEVFQKLVEISPQLVEFLNENFEKVSQVPEIKNAVNLSNAVSQAFNFPKLDYDILVENQSYILKDGTSSSIYEMICQQELVKKELLESKKDFDLVWASHASIKKLSNMIFEEDAKIVESLAEALREVPYLAFASKKSLFTTFNNCLGKTDGVGVSEKDIQQYSSKIFEAKKEAKEMFLEVINETYGINVQNLQEPVSFKSLINTQVVIFEALSRLAPKGSVLKEVLSENALFLKNKSGIEGIDVNDYIRCLFEEAGYTEVITEATKEKEKANKYMDKPKPNLKKISKDLSDMGDVIGSIQANLKANADQEYPSDESVDQKALAAQEVEEPQAAAPEAAPEAPADAPEEGGEEGGEENMPPVSQQDMLGDLSDLETMVTDLAAELGVNDKKDKEEK